MWRRKVRPAAVPHEDWLHERLKEVGFAAEYLNAALAERDEAEFMLALRDVARARGGIPAMARQSRMSRVKFGRVLSERRNSALHSFTWILDAVGLRLVIAAKENTKRRPTRCRQASVSG